MLVMNSGPYCITKHNDFYNVILCANVNCNIGLTHGISIDVAVFERCAFLFAVTLDYAGDLFHHVTHVSEL